MKLPAHLRAIAAQFAFAAQTGALEWDEEAADKHAATAFDFVAHLFSESDALVVCWVKLALEGVATERYRLGRAGYDAAFSVCNLLAEECERLGMEHEV